MPPKSILKKSSKTKKVKSPTPECHNCFGIGDVFGLFRNNHHDDLEKKPLKINDVVRTDSGKQHKLIERHGPFTGRSNYGNTSLQFPEPESEEQYISTQAVKENTLQEVQEKQEEENRKTHENMLNASVAHHQRRQLRVPIFQPQRHEQYSDSDSSESNYSSDSDSSIEEMIKMRKRNTNTKGGKNTKQKTKKRKQMKTKKRKH